MMFERKIFQEMLKWKEQHAPHYALFLKGARRVGKTTLAEKLGREAYESYILIRFDQADQVVKDLFVNGLRDWMFFSHSFSSSTRRSCIVESRSSSWTKFNFFHRLGKLSKRFWKTDATTTWKPDRLQVLRNEAKTS